MENNMNNKKIFTKPELEIVSFSSEDIILTSNFGDPERNEKDVFFLE